MYERFLKNNQTGAWKPTYAFRNSSFNNVIAEYRKKYKTNKSIVPNFNAKYEAWLLGQKALENARKREFQQILRFIKTPKTSVARQSSPARSGRRRNTGNLRRHVLTAPLRARRKELQNKRANLERQLNAVLAELRSLPAH